MKQNLYDPKTIRVEDRRPSGLEKLLEALGPLGLSQFEDPRAADVYQRELHRMEQIQELERIHKLRREGILRKRREGTPPLRKFGGKGEIYNTFDDYLMNRPSRDASGKPLR